jgi:DNA-binding NarL/FixJ family response regulator
MLYTLEVSSRSRNSRDFKPSKRRIVGRTVRTPKRPAAPIDSGSVRIRIVVADELPLDRCSLVALLGTQPDFQVVGEAETTEQAAQMCGSLNPSIVLIAIAMRGHVRRTPIADIRVAAPLVPILAMAERGEEECLVLNPPKPRRGAASDVNVPRTPMCTRGTDCLQIAVAEGASGTIRRTSDPDVLFHAIRTVSLGNAWYEAGTAAAIMLRAHHRSAPNALSPREHDVVDLISTGSSNKEIAQSLGIGVPTVKKHVGHILEKLGVQDRLQVGLYAARNPLLLRPSGPRRS